MIVHGGSRVICAGVVLHPQHSGGVEECHRQHFRQSRVAQQAGTGELLALHDSVTTPTVQDALNTHGVPTDEVTDQPADILLMISADVLTCFAVGAPAAACLPPRANDRPGFGPGRQS